MTVHFCNSPELDLRMITIMGVSVKESDTPIGRFGTGLKYAIATLLRLGHKIEIRIGEKLHVFGLSREIIRDKQFDIVTLDGQLLSFSTQLGRDWEPWMAYRELRSNAMDEGEHYVGPIYKKTLGFSTRISVSGSDIEQVHAQSWKVFCEQETVYTFEESGTVVEICEQRPDIRQTVFYRGVAAGKTDKEILMCYNIKSHMDLTEDRTFKYPWTVNTVIMRAIVGITDKKLLRKLVNAPKDTYESLIPWGDTYQYKISPVLDEIIRENPDHPNLNKSLVKYWRAGLPRDISKLAKLSQADEETINKAQLLARVVCPLYSENPPIKYVASLGSGIRGQSQDGEIYIPLVTVHNGPVYLAQTLVEEWIHRSQGIEDCTREFQDTVLGFALRLADNILDESTGSIRREALEQDEVVF